MKKILSTVLISSSCLFANQLYFGVETGYVMNGETTISSSTDGDSTYKYDGSTSIKFKIGTILKSKNRLEVGINQETQEYDGADVDITGLDVDYKIVFQERNFLPFVSLGLGSYVAKTTGLKVRLSSGKIIQIQDDLTGVSFNLGLGALFKLNSNLELEAAYKIQSIIWQDMIDQTGTTYENDSLQSSLNIGLNYHF